MLGMATSQEPVQPLPVPALTQLAPRRITLTLLQNRFQGTGPTTRQADAGLSQHLVCLADGSHSLYAADIPLLTLLVCHVRPTR